MGANSMVGEFEYVVLLAIARINKKAAVQAYGRVIGNVICNRTGRKVAVGQLCTALLRLRDKKMIAMHKSYVETGRAKQCYRLTKKGGKVVDVVWARLVSLRFGTRAG